MKKFPIITPLSRREYELVTPFSYEWEDDENRYKITVKSGFITDGASVPRPLWWLINPMNGKMLAAAVIHDFLYKHEGGLPKGGLLRRFFPEYGEMVWVEDQTLINRENVDLLFLLIMRDYGVSWWRRNLAYRAVRIAGRLFWGKNNG